MQSISTSPFNLSMLRRRNIWYTFKDGNWSDPGVWTSNGTKKHALPQPEDDVVVNHNITLDLASIIVNNLYISGSINANAAVVVTIIINGDCQVSGSGLISLQSQFHNLVLNGGNNIIPYSNFNAGDYSYLIYNASTYSQAVLNLPYKNLITQGGQKYQVDDVTVGGTFNQQSNYECGAYNLTVNGNSTIGTVGQYLFSKNSPTGSILFIGAADFEGETDLSVGNANVEFRNGFTIHTFSFISGSGTFTFSTNNQTLNFSAYLGGSWNANITVSGAITLTWSGNGTVPINGVINGTISGSTFNNTGILCLGNSTPPMTTGVFNYQFTSTSTIGYVFNGSYTLPYTSYANLIIDGTGTKTQSGNTIIGQTLFIRGNSNGCYYECNGYNLTVEGAFTNQGNFSANSFCNILFIGLATWGHLYDSSAGVDLRTGNPNIEFRNGLTLAAYFTYSGTGTFSFTTNNQNIDCSINNGGIWDSNILISGAISVTFLGSSSPLTNFNGILNGDNINSIFINAGTFVYESTQQPMQTGMLYCNQVPNTFIYGASANQDITVPSDSIPGYQNLVLNGSGAKKLLGDVSVKGIYTLTSPATLNSNTYSLTNP